MENKLYIATSNKHKLIEIERMLAPYRITVAMPSPTLLSQIVEIGDTFTENALCKARYIYEKTGVPTLADDSGLCINALGGRPGVYSARYLGEGSSYNVKMASILNEMAKVDKSSRQAYFECAIAVITGKQEHTFRGRCEGEIGYEPKGENGFGYDPIFVVGRKTIAELTDKEKDRVSHRARALEQVIAKLDTINLGGKLHGKI